MSKRLLGALFALFFLLGFTAACGDDEDDGGNDAAEEIDSGDEGSEEEPSDEEGAPEDEEATDDGEASDIGPATEAFCIEFNEESDEEDTPVEEIEASIERAGAAQAEIADQEVVDAIQALGEFGRYLVDNDDGDGIVTQAETEAAAAEFPDLGASVQVITAFCSG